MAWMEHWQSLNGTEASLYVAGAYVLGCFATGYYLMRARTGRDIRDFSSGSVGARNVGRVLGKSGFLLTVFGDFGKGMLAVWAARRFAGDDLSAGLAMLAVVAGHIWPAQLRFRGGKGVATSIGALLVCDWRLAVTYALVFGVGLAVVRSTVLPGLFAYVCLPLACYWLDHDGLKTFVIGTLGFIVLLAHRKNLVDEIPALAARREVAAKPHEPKL